MVRLENVYKYFNKRRKNEIRAICNTSLELDKGLVALLGPSGCGKTTLLNAIGGLDKVNSGKIYINGKKITKVMSSRVDEIRNLNIGYIFQDYKLIDNMSVFDNVAIVLKMIGIKDKKEIKKRVDYILDKVGMYRYKLRPCSMLSGGERQRVGIARAIVKNPSIILADEPTGNLDSKNTIEIMNIIKSISRDKLVILVTHEADIAKFYATRIIEVSDGKIVKDYENSDNDELDYRMDNKIYLKDYKYHNVCKNDNFDINMYEYYLKRFYNNEENFDIDSIVKSIISTRLFLLHIISHEEIDDIVNKAIVDAKKFDYHNITEKIYNFDF